MVNDSMPEVYRKLYRDLLRFIPPSRLFTGPLDTLALGTDASFYRLIPQIVVKAHHPQEISEILRLCRASRLPVTFRAAGTSLSGQAITDSVLVLAGENWSKIEVHGNGELITLGCGVRGGSANQALRPFRRKIGPDPASIDSAMMGGIAANNASGMCCGVANNTYHTLAGLKVILADGSILDICDQGSRGDFERRHRSLLDALRVLGESVRADTELAALIRTKYKIKNTTGYSLNALTDFEDPFEILAHLMIGSEGTLGFIEELTLRTVPDPAYRASALQMFGGMEEACRSVRRLALIPEVTAVELMDAASLKAVHAQCENLGLNLEAPEGCALLIEVRSEASATLDAAVSTASSVLAESGTPVFFYKEEAAVQRLWQVRKGLFPSVGAVRRSGTSVVIEDICFPVESLAEGAAELRRLLNLSGYSDAILFGHALAGNLHFVFKADWSRDGETARYARFMAALCELVLRFGGSMKAEHGTGRNMAPFVEREWGSKAYGLMQQIKSIFDPDNLLNPGVLLNPDPEIHLKNFKPMPAADALIDMCTECGFCEAVCPSRNLTLTPRQRIVLAREMNRPETAALRRQFSKKLEYSIDTTCAADGLCAVKCPVGIDTGKWVKKWRREKHGGIKQFATNWIARHLSFSLAAARMALKTARWAGMLFPAVLLERGTGVFHRLSGGRLPRWHRFLPAAAAAIPGAVTADEKASRMVYFSCCISRSFQPQKTTRPLAESVQSLLNKAGYQGVYPHKMTELCCGLAFDSKGDEKSAVRKAEELEKALWQASREGMDPVLFDASPCHAHFKAHTQKKWNSGILEPAGFLTGTAAGRLTFSPAPGKVLLHVPCSAQKAGLSQTYREAALLCSLNVVDTGIGCCGVAGDKGIYCPELPASALAGLRDNAAGFDCGVSASAGCEAGLCAHSGLPFQSLLQLADACTRAADYRNPETSKLLL